MFTLPMVLLSILAIWILNVLTVIGVKTSEAEGITKILSKYHNPLPILNGTNHLYLIWTSRKTLLSYSVRCVYSKYIGPGKMSNVVKRTLDYIPEKSPLGRPATTSVNFRLRVINDTSPTTHTRIEVTLKGTGGRKGASNGSLFTLIVVYADQSCLILKDASGGEYASCYMWVRLQYDKKVPMYCEYIYLSDCTETTYTAYDTKKCSDDNAINNS
uniref:Lipocalin n=1 Tax=Rhipicephalus zambeziensis TaxID=60191 RepID=A0A224YNN9_9ACAR